MKAVCLRKPWDIDLIDVEPAKPKSGDALIKIKAASICGSDIGAFRGTNGLVSYPRIIGHELAGEIVSLPDYNPKGLRVGDRVVVDPYLFCNHCYPCSIGRTNCCEDLKVLGVQTDGGMVENFAHPADMLIRVPDDMPWEIIPLAEPLTIALHGLHRLQLQKGEHIVINGAGPIGLLAALAAIHYGAEPILVDIVEERLAFAATLGIQKTVNLRTDDLLEKVKAFTNGRLAECVMEASGANSAIRSTLDIVSHAGRIIFTGWPKGETAIPTDLITRKEVDIRGARTSVGEFEESIDLIYNKIIDVRKLLTKVISIGDVPEVVRDIEKNPGDYLKVSVLL